MTHEQLIAQCFQWHWNTFPDERQMLYGVNNNISDALLANVPTYLRKQLAIQEGNKNKAKGVVSGVLDFCYLAPKGGVVYLDAKVGKDVLSHPQREFIRKIQERGHTAFIFSSFEEFQEIIKALQYG